MRCPHCGNDVLEAPKLLPPVSPDYEEIKKLLEEAQRRYMEMQRQVFPRYQDLPRGS